MKQSAFKGFAAAFIRNSRAPVRMSEEVVAMCRDEADAIAYSLGYAFKRFGYRQIDVAQKCGWKHEGCLSDAKKRRRGFPESRIELFGYVTGCTLLQQFIDHRRGEHRRNGRETDHDRAQAVITLMLGDTQTKRPNAAQDRRAA